MERSPHYLNAEESGLSKSKNFRSISLLSIPSKIFNRILLNKVRASAENILKRRTSRLQEMKIISQNFKSSFNEVTPIIVHYKKAFNSMD